MIGITLMREEREKLLIRCQSMFESLLKIKMENENMISSEILVRVCQPTLDELVPKQKHGIFRFLAMLRLTAMKNEMNIAIERMDTNFVQTPINNKVPVPISANGSNCPYHLAIFCGKTL
jgi:hypothetical protein